MEADISASVIYSEHISEFVKAVGDFYFTKKFWDLIFVCKQNIRVHAHKTVLASFSKFLSELLRSNGQDVAYISLPDIDHEKLNLLLTVLYKGTVRLDHEELQVLKDLCTGLYIDTRNINIQEESRPTEESDNPKDGFPHTSVRKSVRKKRPSKRKQEGDKNEELSDNASTDCSFAFKPEPKKISSYLKGPYIDDSADILDEPSEQKSVSKKNPWCLYQAEKIFSQEQIEILENVHKEHIFPNVKIRYKLAEQLGLTVYQVTRWFTSKMTAGRKVTKNKRPILKALRNDPRNQFLEEAYRKNKYPSAGDIHKLHRDLSLAPNIIRSWFSIRRQIDNQLEIKHLLRDHEETLKMVLKDLRFPKAAVREELAKEMGVSFKQVTQWFVMTVRNTQPDGSYMRSGRDIRYKILEEIYKTNKDLDFKQLSNDLALSVREVMNWVSAKQDKEARGINKLMKASGGPGKNTLHHTEAFASGNAGSGDDDDVEYDDALFEYKDYSACDSYSPCSTTTNELVNIKVEPFMETIVKEEPEEIMFNDEEAMSEDKSAGCSIKADPLITDSFGTESVNQDLNDTTRDSEYKDYSACDSHSPSSPTTNELVNGELEPFVETTVKKEPDENMFTDEEAMSEDKSAGGSIKAEPLITDSLDTESVNQDFNDTTCDSDAVELELPTLTEQQQQVLENVCKEYIYPNCKIRTQLSKQLDISPKHVTNWCKMKVSGKKVDGHVKSLEELLNDPRLTLLESYYCKNPGNPPSKRKLRRLAADLSVSTDVLKEWFKETRQKLSNVHKHEKDFEKVLEKYKFPNEKLRKKLAKKFKVPFPDVTKWFGVKVTNGQADNFRRPKLFRNDPRSELLEEIFKTNKSPNILQVSLDLALQPRFVTSLFKRRQKRENIHILEKELLAEQNKTCEQNATGATVADNSNQGVHFLITETEDLLPHKQLVADTSARVSENEDFIGIHVREDLIKKEASSKDESAQCNMECGSLFTDNFSNESEICNLDASTHNQMSAKKQKDKRAQWSVEAMTAAIKHVQNGGSQKRAVVLFNVPRQTLRRHLNRVNSGGQICKVLGKKPVLSNEQEQKLLNVLLNMESRLYKLTPMCVRYYVFQYCELNGIKHPFNKEKLSAGWDWLKEFLTRHPNLSIRRPQGTYIQRAQGFNETKVNIFFKNLYSALYDESGNRIIPPDQIYNCDESRYTVIHKPPKIISQKVGAITSAEKGKTISILVCTNPSGHYIPPMFLFPRVPMKPELLDRAPVGSIGIATETGWISAEPFAAWFDHFLEKVQPKYKAAPTLLILDGHKSHTRNLPVVFKARENNVKILCLPSHCTHKLQPLDVAVFRDINLQYDNEIEHWIFNHPGRAVTEIEIPHLFARAYSKGASIQNAESGFRKTGIHPFNKNIFTEEEFLGSDASNIPTSDFYCHGELINEDEDVQTFVDDNSRQLSSEHELCNNESPDAETDNPQPESSSEPSLLHPKSCPSSTPSSSVNLDEPGPSSTSPLLIFHAEPGS